MKQIEQKFSFQKNGEKREILTRIGLVVSLQSKVKMASPIEYNVGAISAIVGSGSSLFLGLENGDIQEWEEPGEVRRTLRGHTDCINDLLRCGNVLWSSSFDATTKQWDIRTGNCINTTRSDKVTLFTWRGQVVGRTLRSGLRVWNTDGTLTQVNVNSLAPPTVWKEHLCISNGPHIKVLSTWEEVVMTFQEYSGHIYSMVASGDYLFSGNNFGTIKKWNQGGECLAVMDQHAGLVSCLLMHQGDLYSCSYDNTVKRWSTGGQLLQDYRVHTKKVWRMVEWRGAVFSAASDKKVIQWNPFCEWSPSTHGLFPTITREGIKTVMVLASKGYFRGHSISVDILLIIFGFYASRGGEKQNSRALETKGN